MIKVIFLSFSLLTSGLLAHLSLKSNNKPLNVLFIPVDDLRPDFSVYGNSFVKTPNLDRLAANGVTFTRAYCQQAVCNPSRASLLTGLRPDTLQVWDLKTDMRKIHPDLVTLPQYFQMNGYTTVGLGKTFHNIFSDEASWTKDIYIEGYPFDPDAMYAGKLNNEIIANKKQRFLAHNDSSRIDRYGIWYIKANATENEDVPDDAYYDAIQTTRAIEELKQLSKEEKPFFLSVGFYKPHLPFNAPKKYWDLYDKSAIKLADNQFVPVNSPAFAVHGDQELRSYDDFRDLPLPTESTLSEDRQRTLLHGYYASISYVDAQIGRLLDALESQNLMDNTVIVLWGDHGWKLGEHNSWCKQSNYEIDTRVPLIISGNMLQGRGQKSDALVELVDLFPTLAELANLQIPKYLHGLSLKTVLNQPKTIVKPAAFSQFLLGRFPSRPEVPERMGYAIRTENFRYVEWYSWENESPGDLLAIELFDHTKDPDENKNVAGEAGYSKVKSEHYDLLRNKFKLQK